LKSVLLDVFDGEYSSSLTSAAAKDVVKMASQTAIDHCIWHFPDLVEGLPTGLIFLPFMSHLRFLQIDVDAGAANPNDLDVLSFLLRSLQISLTSPTLEHLKCDIKFYADCYALENFRQELREYDIWGHLDSMITHPTGSQLQRMDIDITYYFYEGDDIQDLGDTGGQICGVILEVLPSLREKGILFVTASEECRSLYR